MKNTAPLSIRPLLSYGLAAMLLMTLTACQQEKSPQRGPDEPPAMEEKDTGKTMSETGGSVQVSGQLIYLQRIALPPNAKATVQLLDVSLADAPAKVVAKQVIELENRQIPVPFSLQIGRDKLKPRHSYSLAARIEDGSGRLLWITDSHHGVNTGQDGDIDLGDIRLTQASSGTQSENRQ